MITVLGIYFSGSGNTRFCVESFCSHFEGCETLSIEDARVTSALNKAEEIVLGYPIQFSSVPKIVRDFLSRNQVHFAGKRVYIIATMGLFSGDGAGCGARQLKRYGTKIVGGLHVKMPDCIGDVSALKKPLEENQQLIRAAEVKLAQAADSYQQGKPTREGLGFFYHLAGLFGQRLWFYTKTRQYTDKLRIDPERCIGCGLCADLCPMDNLRLVNKKASAGPRCTMCYRCINNCPKQAITLLGKTVVEQCRVEKYLPEPVPIPG